MKTSNSDRVPYKIDGNALTESPPPLLVRARAGEGASPVLCSLTGPRCLCQISATALDAQLVVAGPLLEPPVPPLLRVAAPGPWCGASVGTTGSAPCDP